MGTVHADSPLILHARSDPWRIRTRDEGIVEWILHSPTEASEALICSPALDQEHKHIYFNELRTLWAGSLTQSRPDRHRGGGHPPTPATPPCVRVRTRRFETVTLTVLE